MKFGANLHASVLPSHVKQINLGGMAPSAAVTDWTTVPALGDPLGNDRWGCCCYAAKWTWARLKYASRYGKVQPIATTDVLRDYAHTGFDPATGAHDNGTDPNEMMLAWAKDPSQLVFEQENWPVVWATVHPAMTDELAEAIAHGPLLMSIEASAADLDDPDKWCNPPPVASGPLEGHEVLLCRNGPMWAVASWGSYYDFHPSRVSQIVRIDAALEAAHTDLSRLGLDFSAT